MKYELKSFGRKAQYCAEKYVNKIRFRNNKAQDSNKFINPYLKQ